ncbi:biotin/lipoyl-binding protein [Nocardioides sp. W7]|uniref:biotin/lipoyl-binding protein n=1 Tax=Nocardioides sp. W7 TaxID=2931390 RepID=UPI001FD27011|nr:biotin/lipoyl-binding protein [Nocardioides sp. W7]
MPRLFRGRSRRLLAVPVVLLVAVGGTGAWLLTREESVAVEPTTSTVSSETVRETVAASGTIAAARRVDLSFEVSGTVTRVLVAEGDKVRKGQALARIGASTLLARRTAAVATLDAAYTPARGGSGRRRLGHPARGRPGRRPHGPGLRRRGP